MYSELMKIADKPKPFEFYTAIDLWDDDHISQKMLEFHLNGDVEPASRPTNVIRRSVEWISSEFQIGPGTKLADFGCGPGLYTAPFAEIGAEVTGIDFSRRSIAYATKVAGQKRLGIDYVLGNYLEFESAKRFDVITLIYCDFCALSPGQRSKLLGIFHKHLADGGVLLFDALSAEAFKAREEVASFAKNLMGGFWSPSDYMGFMQTFLYEEQMVALDKYTIVEPDRIRVIYNWLQYFTLESISRELEENGFMVEARYANATGQAYCEDSPEMALIARKA